MTSFQQQPPKNAVREGDFAKKHGVSRQRLHQLRYGFVQRDKYEYPPVLLEEKHWVSIRGNIWYLPAADKIMENLKDGRRKSSKS